VTPGGELPQATRMLEARLFHQYMTSTYHTLSQDGLSANHLSINIPRMATSFVYLLDGIHALSALHLASIETENRASWLDAAFRYQSQACSGLGKVLPDITAPDYEPAFVTSVFIMLFAMGHRAISIDSQPPDPLSVVREVRTLITGPAMLFDRIVQGGFHAKLEAWMHVPDTKESLQAGVHSQYGASHKLI
jgi:gamma-glutamyltranspeptidase/glutathione hydrolase